MVATAFCDNIGFFKSPTEKRCDKDYECSGTDLCGHYVCTPLSEFRKCPEDKRCGFEYSCMSGVCRYMSDFDAERRFSNFGPDMKCKDSRVCPIGLHCSNGNCV